MGGCFGGLNKHSTLTPSVAESSKGRKSNYDQPVKRGSISEDLWTTSTCDMDNNAAQSQGSFSSFTASNQTMDSTPSQFVNHGLLLWSQTRQRWIGNKKSAKQGKQVREKKLSRNTTYENLLGSNKPFPKPIPLPEMVEFLVDVWEQEGMYD